MPTLTCACQRCKLPTDFDLYIFMHAFLTLSWTLINRSVSTGNINFAHITYVGDHLLINQPRNKSDQTGERTYARSVLGSLKSVPSWP